MLRSQNLDFKVEEELMDLKKECLELNRNLYPPIEPYSTGFLNVSDLHSIYWEQSGNPSGHVSFLVPLPMYYVFLSLIMISVD